MLGDRNFFLDQYGPWALIAGASEGIGLDFAQQLAAKGINLVLLSRSGEKLRVAANAITALHNVDIRMIEADLSHSDCLVPIAEATHDIDIGLMIYNAGAVHSAEFFLDQSLESQLALINLNCRSPLALAHHFAQPMRERERGGMIFLSSMAAFAGGSYVATYAGTKAFDIVFPQSLWHELAPHNVHVMSLVAGATRTPAMAAAGLDLTEQQDGGPAIMDAVDVAIEGLAKLGEEPVWIAGEHNRQAAEFFATLPRKDLINAMSMGTAGLFNQSFIPAN